jgi:glycosyltransferase 2 family protein
LNLGVLKKVVIVLILFVIGIFLIHAYWKEILPILQEIVMTIRETRLRYLFLAISVYILSVYLFAVRWQQVLSCIGYHVKALSLLPIFFGAIFITNITPGGNMAGGESFRILWANKSFNISYTDAFKTILFERSIEMIPVTFLLIYILYSFPALEIKYSPLIDNLTLKSTYLLLIFITTIGFIVWFFRAPFISLLRSAQQSWRQLKKSVIPVLLLSAGIWILDVTRLKAVALALNLDIPLNLLIAVSIISLLLGLLPLTPGGIGIVEGGLISLLLYLGFPFASASSFVFLERFISYGVSSLIGSVCLFYYGGYKIWQNSRKDSKSNDQE